jgi:hypothetical protein
MTVQSYIIDIADQEDKERRVEKLSIVQACDQRQQDHERLQEVQEHMAKV